MSARTTSRGYLACEQDGAEEAGRVCGQCGAPVCTNHSKTIIDPTLTDHSTGGSTLLAGLALVLSPLLVAAIPRPVWLTLSDLAGGPLYIRGALKRGLLIVGLTLLATLHGRRIESGFKLLDFELLTSDDNPRTVCEECYRVKRTQKYAGRALGGIAVLLIGYSLYVSLPQLTFTFLWVAGVGVALWLVRYKIVGVVFRILEEPGDSTVLSS